MYYNLAGNNKGGMYEETRVEPCDHQEAHSYQYLNKISTATWIRGIQKLQFKYTQFASK